MIMDAFGIYLYWDICVSSTHLFVVNYFYIHTIQFIQFHLTTRSKINLHWVYNNVDKSIPPIKFYIIHYIMGF
jgi:hypothetical protein